MAAVPGMDLQLAAGGGRPTAAQALERVYLDLLDGHIDPAEGHLLSLRPDA